MSFILLLKKSLHLLLITFILVVIFLPSRAYATGEITNLQPNANFTIWTFTSSIALRCSDHTNWYLRETNSVGWTTNVDLILGSTGQITTCNHPNYAVDFSTDATRNTFPVDGHYYKWEVLANDLSQWADSTHIQYHAYDLNDKTTNGNNLTNHGTTSWTTDAPFAASSNSAKLVRASSQYLSASDSSSLSITGNMTVEAWVKLDSLPSGANNTQTIVGKYDGSSNRSHIFGIWRNGSGTLGMTVALSTNGSTVYVLDKPYSFSTGTWYHIAYVYTASTGTVEFFVNGSSQGTATNASATSIFNGTADFNIGAFNNGTSEYFDGKIDEVRVWNTARTATQISDNKSTELTGTESGLAAYYPLETLPVSALSLTDKTSNGNNLTNVGTTEWAADFPFAASSKAVKMVRSSTQYLSAADSSSLSITGNMTVEAWVKLDSLPSGASSTQTIVAKYNGSSDRSYIFGIWRNASSTLGMTAALSPNGSSVYVLDKSYSFSTGTWYHIAYVYTAATGTVEFFVNGSSQGTASNASATSLYNGIANFEIGAFNHGASEFFDGKIDDVRVWNTARTSTQINDNKSSELTGTESGLAAYYPFETL